MSPVPPIDVPPPLPAELVPLNGSDWNRVIPVRDTDGDTVRLLRQQLSWELIETCELGDSLRLTEWKLRVVEDDVDELPTGLAARLVHLDTPELHSADLAERTKAKVAAAQLWRWVTEHRDRLRCVTYDTGGGFDRILIDLYILGADGRVEDSASEFMLRAGWPRYVKGQ